MINLLPPSEKEKILMEKFRRMVVILWFLVAFFLVCLILIFLSIRVYAESQLQAQQSLYSQIKEEDKMKIIESFKNKVDLINSDIDKLSTFYGNKIYFSSTIEHISSTLPQGVYLKDISLVYYYDKKMVDISLAGFSPSRGILLDLKKNLEAENDFENIEFSQSDWVKESNIDFSIKLELKVD